MTKHPIRSLAALCLVLLFAAPLRAQQPDVDRWYVVMLGGERIGHMRHTQTTDGDKITTAESLRVAIKRGQVAVEVEQGMTFTETADGKPVEASMSMRMAQMPTAATFTFNDDGVTIERTANGQVTTEHEPLPEGDYLTPAAALRAAHEQASAGVDKITLSVLDISTGFPAVAEVTQTRVGPQNIEVMGKTVPAVAWDLEQSGVPGVVMREFHDADGQMLRTTISLGMLNMEMIAADEAVATSPVDPPELVASTLVKPIGDVPHPRQLRRAVYKLTLPEDFKGDLSRAGYQRVTWADERTALVVQDLDEPVNPDGDEPDESNLAATTMLDASDPAVRKLVAEALGDDADQLTPPQKAERLRAFVHSYVTSKNLSVGFATASEVAQTAEGDCTEHAVLLAALLRAADIPSRTVTGLIYVDHFVGEDDIFGYHMWTQAWLTPSPGTPASDAGARWVDLDATLDEPFDAAHIALGASAMSEGSLFNDMIALAPLLSQLKIEVLDTR